MRHGDRSLLVERPFPGVVELRLNRPAKRNAIDAVLVKSLNDTVLTLTPDDRVVVLSSTDPTVFSAGADLHLEPKRMAEVSDRLYGVYEALVASPCIIIAAVSGYAIGGGAQLALTADLRIGSAATEFRFVGAANGAVVAAWALPALVGRAKAMEILTRMTPVIGVEALSCGLLNTIADDPRTTALEWAASLAKLDGKTLTGIKMVVVDATGIVHALRLERSLNHGWPARSM